ncbi:thioredoxin family protein [Rhodohalobacter sulfatireducens]|uniref:Thioredoxin domain-containing protein n=1 Tax=Rhodohalobacter sulfatireducens TaxID=2911366 RepID=A0ABS9KCJ2_9BACT|nr:thioredoxin domain-containing protein [Rhodohalobacter sulfatireducens]
MNRTQSSNTAFLIVAFMLIGSLFLKPAIAQDKSIYWRPFEEALQIAEKKQQVIIVDVWAPWCGWCKKMEKQVYPNVSENLSTRFVWTRLNRDDNNSTIQFSNQPFSPLRLAQKLNVQNVPALVFLAPNGDYLFHKSGFTEVNTFESIMSYIASDTNPNGSYENFISTNQ